MGQQISVTAPISAIVDLQPINWITEMKHGIFIMGKKVILQEDITDIIW